MKGVKSWIGIFSLCVFATLESIGFSSWFVKNENAKQYYQDPDTNSQKVAYTQSTTNGNLVNTYYTTLDAAIKNTNSGTIYVIPGTNPTLHQNATIAKDVTLSLPYEDDLKNTHTVEDSGRTSTGNFADYVESNNKSTVYCQSNVTIADGVTLTNNGTIFVGGVLGRNGQAPTGMTVGKYSKITLGSNSSISNYGTITSYGFIKESTGVAQPGKVVSSGSGVLNLPVVIYDFRGGWFSLYAVGTLRVLDNWKTMPFSVFDFPNIQCDVYFTGNSGLNGEVTVYANDNVVTSRTSLIGPSSSSSLIRLTSGTIKYRCSVPKGYLYDDYAQGTTESMVNRTKFTVNGNISIANMEVDVGVSIKTSEFHLPFSYKFAFDFESGEINIANKVKFLAGCVFHIGKNAKVNINAETVFYQNYIPKITTGRGDGYPRYAESSSLINDGTLNINSSFGGIVSSSSELAKTITGNSFSASVGTTEALTGQTGGVKGTNDPHTENAKFTLIDKQFFDSTDDTKMLYGKSNSSLNSDIISGGTSYTSYALDKSDNYGWHDGGTINDVTYGIRYELNSETAVNTNSVTSFNKSESSISLKKMTNTSGKYSFDGLYYDSKFTKRLEDGTDGDILLNPSTAIENLSGKNHVVLYAKWIDSSKAKYTVESITSNTDDHSSTKQISSTPANYVVGEGFTLEKPNEFYVYENLVTDNGTGSIVTYSFDGYLIQIYDGDGELTDTSIEVDNQGNSTNGEIVNFVFKDTSLLKENYKVVATAKYTAESSSFTLSINSGTNTVSKESKTNISVNGLDAFKNKNISLTFEWSANNSKATFGNKLSDSTYVFNNYSGTWGAATSSTDVSICCTIKDGNLTISKPSKTIKFKKGIAE